MSLKAIIVLVLLVIAMICVFIFYFWWVGRELDKDEASDDRRDHEFDRTDDRL